MKNTDKYGKKIEEIPFDLKISADEPLRLDFIRSGTGKHIFGYVTIWDDELIDPEIIFSNIGPDAALPSDGSFDFTRGMSGAGLDFFLINDGFSLNHRNKEFSKIISGKGGRLAFIDRFNEWQNILRKDDDGNLQWVNKQSGQVEKEAMPATVKSVNPLLVWIPDDDGDVQIIDGHIFHTFARMGTDFLGLNPDGFCHAKVFFEGEDDAIAIGFCEMLDPDSGLYNDVKFRFMIGKENVNALKPAMINVGSALNEVEEDVITSASLKITDGFTDGDVLRPWAICVEEDGAVDGLGVTFTNMDGDGSLVLNGRADKAVYETLFKHIRVGNLSGNDLDKPRGLALKIMTDGGVYNLALDGIAVSLNEQKVVRADDIEDEKMQQDFEDNEENTLKNKAEDYENSDIRDDTLNADGEDKEPEYRDEASIREALKKDLETALEEDLDESPFKAGLDGLDDFDESESVKIRPSPLAVAERKTVLITGAAKRVGKELALSFAADGWNVIIHCNSSLDEARELAKEIAKRKVRTAVLQADLSDESEVVQIFPQVFDVFDRVDLLINNASVFDDDNALTATAENWHKQLMINTRAPILLARDFAGQFLGKSDKIGNVINITDAGLCRARKGLFSYAISKNALEYATRLMALEFAPLVRVNAVAPWMVSPSKYDSAKEFEKKVAASPLGVNNSAAEIYVAIKFILGADSMTGQTITLDSGSFL